MQHHRSNISGLGTNVEMLRPDPIYQRDSFIGYGHYQLVDGTEGCNNSRGQLCNWSVGSQNLS